MRRVRKRATDLGSGTDMAARAIISCRRVRTKDRKGNAIGGEAYTDLIVVGIIG